jgi:hypothetical protein
MFDDGLWTMDYGSFDIIFLGSDHLDTFSVTCVPTFAIICGQRVIADHVGHHYDLPNHRETAEDLLDKLIHAGFDIAYSEDALLGHTFATPFEYLIEKRNIPVVPFFTNVYLPPLPTAKRCSWPSRRRSDQRTQGAGSCHCQRRYVALSRHQQVSKP